MDPLEKMIKHYQVDFYMTKVDVGIREHLGLKLYENSLKLYTCEC